MKNDRGWQKDAPLQEWLYEAGHDFDFFQAVRLLTLMAPYALPSGEANEAGREPVRFRARTTLAFPASDVHEVRRAAMPQAHPELVTNFFSLGGFGGPLPYPDTELLLERSRYHDAAFADFLDILHHRLLSLLVRIRRSHHPTFAMVDAARSRPGALVLSIAGLGPSALRNRLRVPDQALMFYAGILSAHPRSASGLECVLTDYFGVPVRVKQFRGGWRTLGDDQRTAIGEAGRNRTLGTEAVLGARYWDQSSSVEIGVGPLKLAQFFQFLPIGSALQNLRELTGFYVSTQMTVRVRLTLRAADVPECRLRGQAYLGWTTWLRTRPFSSDDSQVCLLTGVGTL